MGGMNQTLPVVLHTFIYDNYNNASRLADKSELPCWCCQAGIYRLGRDIDIPCFLTKI